MTVYRTRESRFERARRTLADWPWIVRAGAALALAIVLMLVAVPANAGDQMVYTSGELSVTLTKGDCLVPPVGVAIAQAGAPEVFAAVIRIGSTEIAGCWGLADDKVLVGDEFGRAGFIEFAEFRAKPAI